MYLNRIAVNAAEEYTAVTSVVLPVVPSVIKRGHGGIGRHAATTRQHLAAQNRRMNLYLRDAYITVNFTTAITNSKQ